MTEAEAREIYGQYYHAIERQRKKAFCKECGGIGFKPVLKREIHTSINKDDEEITSEDWFVTLQPCECVVMFAEQVAIKASGTAETIKVKILDNFTTNTPYHRAMKEKAIHFLSDYNKHWFICYGQSGCGKTHICTALMGELLKRGKRVRYMRWLDDVRRIKSNLNDLELIDSLKKCDVLYIDDLFKGKYSDYDLTIAFEILNYRYSNRATTIISTERMPQELERIDRALYGRMCEMAEGFVVGVGLDAHKDMRRKE